MCGGDSPSTPDTSAQEAEAARQREETERRNEEVRYRQEAEAQRQREIEQQRWEQRYAAERQESAERLAWERAEAERQRAASEAYYREQIDLQKQAGQQAQAAAARQEEMARQEYERARAAEQQRADQARAEAAAKQAAIDRGQTAVNDAFKGFDDSYFDKMRSDYVDFYKPDIQQQFDDAQRDATFALANMGQIDSSVASDAYARLAARKVREETDLAQRASSAAANLRSDLAGQRSDLLSRVVAAGGVGDFATPAQQAAAAAGARDWSPIGDIFAGLVAPGEATPTAAPGSTVKTAADWLAEAQRAAGGARVVA